MKLTDKCLKEISKFEEAVLSEPEYRGKKVRALLRIDDLTNEKNLSQNFEDESEYFYMPNKHDIPNLKRVDVKVKTDNDEVSEIHKVVRRRLNQVKVKKENAGFITPHGGKSPPDQSRETYANLLKDTVKVQQVNLKNDTEDKDLKKHKSPVHVRMTDDYRDTNRTANYPSLLSKR